MRATKRHSTVEPSHPGDVIGIGLAETGIKRVDLARALGVSRNTLYKLLMRKQGVTAEMAVRLGAVWGGSPELWLDMQMDHDLWHARRRVDASRLQRLREAA